MLTLSDFVRVPYTHDLTEAGSLYACRCLALDLIQADNLNLAPLHRLSAEIAADLAFRRYLAQEHIPIQFLDTEPFTHPDRIEIILGGRPCHVINTSISRKSYIDRIKGNPEVLLSAPAGVPEAALASERWGYQDLLIFTFTLAMPRFTKGTSAQAQAESNADCFIYILPEPWRKVGLKDASPALSIQSASDAEIALELGGQASNRDFVGQNIRFPSRLSEMTLKRFAKLAYISMRHTPNATISIHDPRHKRTLHVTPDRWGNLGTDGVEIILAGYIEVGEFRRHANRLRPSARPWGFDYSPSPSLSISMQSLLSLPGLVDWIRSIQESK